ncbi:S-adenosyl-L-methionine-dependent methyltransferase [Astrocystis sublimbata]|nr:S-adenosyl-L-methionine-dependent methyltransferase [Astrocystis sublimbata]
MSFNKDDALSLAEGLENLLEDFDPETLDYSTRRRLSEAARKLSLATEAPGDSVHRIAHSSFQLPLALIGVQTGLFDALSDLNGATSTDAKLAEMTHMDAAFLRRLLRYYQSFGIISQTADCEYGANNITRALVSLGGRSALPFIFSAIAPAINALPEFLQENKYANMTDSSRVPWYQSHDTQEPIFSWINERPEVLKNFMGWMAGQRDGLPTFLDVVDFEAEFAQGTEASTPVLVDVGGSMGHQCLAVRQRYPSLVGRIVLQDLPETIEKVQASPLPGFEGVETMAHDFFTPQTLRGARTYYLRNVLHDWPDDKCVEILQNLKPAMTAESRILVDEMILPERDAPWRATQQDFIMGAVLAAQERSLGEWERLFERAGFKIERMWKYTEELSDHVIVLGLK